VISKNLKKQITISRKRLKWNLKMQPYMCTEVNSRDILLFMVSSALTFSELTLKTFSAVGRQDKFK
jgi:hypothetical protein